jgi:hypothetical protein
MRDGKQVGRRIEGGTVKKVSKGDVLFFPESVPHQATEGNITFLTFEGTAPACRSTLKTERVVQT